MMGRNNTGVGLARATWLGVGLAVLSLAGGCYERDDLRGFAECDTVPTWCDGASEGEIRCETVAGAPGIQTCSEGAIPGCYEWLVTSSCDDSDPCTDDSCASSTACGHAFNTAPCDDGALTTGNDRCDGSGVCGGTTISCTPGICEASSTPDGAGCDVTFEAAGTSCDDGLPGTRDDVCSGGGDCDGVPYTCTVAPCVASSTPNGTDCDVVFSAASVPCNDGDPTTGGDHCDGAGGCAGTPLSCEPSQCEVSSTPNGDGCLVVYKAANVACDDGNPSTGGDLCDGSGACVGTPIICAPTQCQASSTPNGTDCDVTFKAASALCNDGSKFTHTDLCDGAGGCAGTPYACMAGQCDVSSKPNGVDCDVVHKTAAAKCDDGDDATQDDLCNGVGGCAGKPYVCTATQCEASSTPNGTGCDVTYKGDAEPCDDGDPATTDDTCDGSGGCAGVDIGCAPSQCEVSSTPNGTGCDVVYKPDTEPCNDGDKATGGDHCDGDGGCSGAPIICTLDPCDASATPNGTGCHIVPKDTDAPCDDGDITTHEDTCDGDGECAGVPYECAPDQCQLTSVHNGTDCDVVYKASAVGCDDGFNATHTDLCDGSGVCAGTPYICAHKECEISSDPNGVDCDVKYKPAASPCHDANLSTHTDICDGAGTCMGTPFACTPTQCEASSTPNGVDCNITFKAVTEACDDGNPLTTDDHCNGAGVCVGTLND